MENQLTIIDPKEINVKFKELQNYFKKKLIEKDFIIKEITEHILKVEVDEKYIFSIWIGNIQYPDTVNLYSHDYNAMDLDFLLSERRKLCSSLKKIVKEYLNKKLLKEKQKQLLELEKSIQKLKS